MDRISAVEIKCPHCQKVVFRFGGDIISKGKFVCPICENDLFDRHIKPPIDAMLKYNSASTYFRENSVTLIL